MRDVVLDRVRADEQLGRDRRVVVARDEIVVATKMDATGAAKNAAAFKKKVKNLLEISAVTGDGLKPLIRELFRATAPGDEVE